MTYTKEAMAALLHGREYCNEMDRHEIDSAKESGLVVVFGYSDDCVEFRGAIYEEASACDGATVHLHRGGILTDPSQGDCRHCKERTKEQSAFCVPLFAKYGKDGYSWAMEIAIPHARFEIMEDEEKFCRGLVFNLADLPKLP